MSPEAQRIAIAEACGWEFAEMCPWAPWIGPDNRNYKAIPDYLSDLNAMHEAEKVLTPAQQLSYWRELDTICQHPKYLFVLTHATAAQRAEAFLRTIGKWKDSA